ncbi:WxL domain-containing protein [Enterococcus hulanensis]|uniref:WxL domain-containing protein n=1 Tax=Enterococcus hulanensis TaxID=2559929 RepID=UPI0028919961|nr:WxL domain-containing protein [Enterococcus hulanensis]MDT2662531.1 WxL domain-containing protein [Enterococcus hulanensis]
MNRKNVKLLLLLVVTLVSILAGITLFPQKSEAYYVNLGAEDLYLEFVDNQGNEIPISMGLEARYITAQGMYPTYNTLLSNDPLAITKTSGRNHFALHMPAFTKNSSTIDYIYIGYISRLKMNTPIPYIQGIQAYPPVGVSAPKKDTFLYSWAQERPSGIGGSDIKKISFNAVKNVDNTYSFNADTGGNQIVIGGYDHLHFGIREYLADNGSYNGGAFEVYGRNGDTIRFYVIYYQIKEIFEDESGALIDAPSGYTNERYENITNQPFGYKMTNDSSLPKTYTDSGYIYTYKGWYKGSGNKASMDTTHPPSIGFNATLVADWQNEVHVVYNKRAIRTVDEEYIDTSSATIEPSWNNMGQTMVDGDTFNQTPAATKTDSSGTEWEYLGWKLGSEPMSAMKTTPVSHVISANTTIQYVYQKKQHMITEKWVDQADGTTLVPMTGNPKSNAVDDNDPFSGSPAATITDSGGGIWDYTGWENATDAAGTVNSAASFTINNIKGGKEIRYHYQARNTTANLDLNPTPQVVASGGTVAWSSRLTNTGTSTLNNLTLKATSNWASGLSAPTQVTVTPAGGAPQNFTVSPVDWAGGFNLTGINVPNGGPNNYADITFTDTATGAVNQVLPAEIEIDGNMASPLTAENFVRIDDPDELNLNPSGNAGLINIPKFEFGDVEVKPFAQTKGLDAASYQAGYNPYIRYKDQESLVGWDLTVKLSQFTSGSKTLPTTTSIKLNNGDLKEVHNYNKGNESLSSVGSIGNKTIFSDGTTVALTNGTAQGVYQLDYAFNDVELELLAHSGIAGLRYEANMDWTLTTTP